MDERWLAYLFPRVCICIMCQCFMTNIKAANMKNTEGKSATPPTPPSLLSPKYPWPIAMQIVVQAVV